MVEKWVPAEWSHYYRHWTERSNPAKSNNYAREHQEHHMEGQGTQGFSAVRQGHDQAMRQTVRAPSFQILTFS